MTSPLVSVAADPRTCRDHGGSEYKLRVDAVKVPLFTLRMCSTENQIEIECVNAETDVLKRGFCGSADNRD